MVDWPRSGRRGGGTALVHRDSLTVKKFEAGEKVSFEFSDWLIQSESHNIRTVVIYRPPYSDDHKVTTGTFFAEFADYVESIVLCSEVLVILGDFNIHLDDSGDCDSIKLLDLIESFGLKQHVVEPTHILGHTLDLVITRQSDEIIKVLPRVDRFISDHGAVLFRLGCTKPSLSVKTISYRKLKSIDLDALQSDLAQSDLCSNPPDSLDDLVSCYNGKLKDTLEKHAPLMTKTIVERPRVPWFNDEIRKAKRDRRRAEKRWRKTKSASDLSLFKATRNAATSLMNKARKEYYASFIEENSGDQRKLFMASKRLLNGKPGDALPPNINGDRFAEEIGKFFVQKIVDIRNRLNPGSLVVSSDDLSTTCSNLSVDQLAKFELLTEENVKSLLKRSSQKSCLLDPMPSRLVSQCDVLIPVLTKLVNISLQSGNFPNEWKEALVIPLLKKPGLDLEFKNFRPVSNLPFVSKLTERAVFDQIQSHMLVHNLYPSNQSSYRKHFSTETSLLRVKNDILLNMNRQHVSLLVLLDLSSAFDTVDHDVLLRRLNSAFSISGTVLEWFSSYLEDRSQRVMVRGSLSQSFKLNCGVPQGSCLGPLLFTIYVSKLFDVVKNHLPTVHCYADDTQLFVSFSPNEDAGQDEAVAAVLSCIDDIRKWMTMDKLLLNDDKTEVLMIGTKQQLAKIDVNNIAVGQSEIVPKSVVKNLGVWFDSTLSMNTHINKACSAAFYYLYNIRRIRKYLSRESTETLIHAFVSCRIDYCNSILYGLPAYQLHKLQRVQNAAARLIFQQPRYCQITPLLCSLHWLPVVYRIEFKMLLLTYKAIHGCAPDYIKELISIKSGGRYNLRSSNNGILLSQHTFKSYKTLGDRSFVVAAPKLWNALPSSIRSASSLVLFKKLLKTFLFKRAFLIV